jgi:hypothetical protein
MPPQVDDLTKSSGHILAHRATRPVEPRRVTRAFARERPVLEFLKIRHGPLVASAVCERSACRLATAWGRFAGAGCGLAGA